MIPPSETRMRPWILSHEFTFVKGECEEPLSYLHEVVPQVWSSPSGWDVYWGVESPAMSMAETTWLESRMRGEKALGTSPGGCQCFMKQGRVAREEGENPESVISKYE